MFMEKIQKKMCFASFLIHYIYWITLVIKKSLWFLKNIVIKNLIKRKISFDLNLIDSKQVTWFREVFLRYVSDFSL